MAAALGDGPSNLATIATCNLDQWALDWDGNLRRIEESIRRAKGAGARYRLGPELEVTGYGCEDHFLEPDTLHHAWQSLARLLATDLTDGILCDVGMPVLHRGVRYNCRLLVLNRRILLIRPKLILADDGNYRETRWFAAYQPQPGGGLEQFRLPHEVTALTGQTACPLGIAVLQCRDATLASETCEELFAPASPHISLFLDGVDIVTNGSGSHHELRKLHTRVDLMRGATVKGGGGVYVYANQQGCDGGRLYFDGCAMIIANGQCLAQGSQFSLRDVEVKTATVDLDEVRSGRAAAASRSVQAAAQAAYPRIEVDFALCYSVSDVVGARGAPPIFHTPSAPVHYLSPSEEIALGPACWLWDWLRRSGASGYFLPLSGGADSAATAALVGIMTRLVFAEIEPLLSGRTDIIDAADRQLVLDNLRRCVRDPDFHPTNAGDIANRVMHTCYMGTVNSSVATRDRAADVARDIGGYHVYACIDAMVAAVISVFVAIFGDAKQPRFGVHGGSRTEDVALQNIQARLRMVLAYFLAQLLPWIRGLSRANGPGFLLVLGSANVDEALRGYLTKYDCSSADINPIGGIAKGDLKEFLLHASKEYQWSSLATVVSAPPSAELVPIIKVGDGAEESIQLDEVDMGMSYSELGWFGKLRKVYRCGPVSMYRKLLAAWPHLTPHEVAEKVKRFFTFYSINRHKLTTLTPSYHAESYSPDDNRFDLRPFLYNTSWERSFDDIDSDVLMRSRR